MFDIAIIEGEKTSLISMKREQAVIEQKNKSWVTDNPQSMHGFLPLTISIAP